MLDEGNEFNKSSLGSHMLATLPGKGENKLRPSFVAVRRHQAAEAALNGSSARKAPPGGRLIILSKVAFGDGRLPKLP